MGADLQSDSDNVSKLLPLERFGGRLSSSTGFTHVILDNKTVKLAFLRVLTRCARIIRSIQGLESVMR